MSFVYPPTVQRTSMCGHFTKNAVHKSDSRLSLCISGDWLHVAISAHSSLSPILQCIHGYMRVSCEGVNVQKRMTSSASLLYQTPPLKSLPVSSEKGSSCRMITSTWIPAHLTVSQLSDQPAIKHLLAES